MIFGQTEPIFFPEKAVPVNDNPPESKRLSGRFPTQFFPLNNCGAVEEERVFQVRRCFELEVEEEGRDASSQGHQSIHQGAMCLQGEACVADCEGPCTQAF